MSSFPLRISRATLAVVVAASLCCILNTVDMTLLLPTVVVVDAFVPVLNTKTIMSTKLSKTTSTTSSSSLSAFTSARNGLQWEDKEVGTGRRVNKGDAVLCYYKGSYQKGFKPITFDETEPGEPVEFLVGRGQMIPGCDIGIVGSTSLEIDPMKIGGERNLKIPAALAYGSQQVGPIPANTDLEFEIVVVNAQPSSGIDSSTKLKGFAALFGTLGFFAVLGLFIAQNYNSWF